jgi:putative PIN family toxin of toxin-antitoxin system
MTGYKVIIDTNLWISLLIGKRISAMRDLCNSKQLSIYVCEDLMAEFRKVSSSPKIKKYVTQSHIAATLELMESSTVKRKLKTSAVAATLRDAKDLYLLSLADTVSADYLITGDKDLLILQKHNQTRIVTFSEFMAIIQP